ncbi:excalibur calcium-binding protein [Streptomyces sp. JB150]|uniref:excalibur calcium-binding protein n=1 Tax=Streptomyces sp. JB150 TaxID=2714844 RepID=UPI001408F087|nr:excalibur calcium-binding protein [Streptomyces sp. JB150]QIJ61489.1 excalibur calcium-binding protein [Streptomyces sp. JB150]
MRRHTGAAGIVLAIAATMPLAGPAHAQDDLDCRHFAYQEDAQSVYDSDPRDPHGLDEDQGADDGVACEVLPRRGGGLTSSTFAPRRTATPAVTATSLAPAPVTTPAAPVATATQTPRGVRGGLGGASQTGPGTWDLAVGAAFVAGAALTTAYVVRRRRN